MAISEINEMMDEEKNEPGKEVLEEEKVTGERIRFIYTRSNFYREISAGGAYGGLTPELDIHMTLFNQHSVDFKEQVFYLTENGRLGPEVKRENDKEYAQEINREIEVGITMNIATAINLTRWLRGKIMEAQKIIGADIPQEDAENKLSTT
jgi:hypothetical protein